MHKLKELFDSFADALQAVSTIVGVGVMLGVGWAVAWNWVKSWDWMQRGLMIFVAALLFFLLALASYSWWRSKRVYRIPALLYKLDSIIRNYVEQFDPNNVSDEDAASLARDLGELMHLAIYPLGNAYRNKNRNAIASQTERYSKTIGKLDVDNSSSERLKLLMQISALMDEHNSGLKIIKATPQYRKLFEEIKLLERIQPNPYVSIKIDDYFRWSDGYYSQLIGMKFITSKPEMFQLSPAEYRATVAYSKPVIEDYMDVLIAAVAESQQKGKVDLPKNTEGDGKK
jgi:hypothetical protein